MRTIFVGLTLMGLGACSSRSGLEMMAANDRNTLSQVCVMNETAQAGRVLKCGFADARKRSAQFSNINFK